MTVDLAKVKYENLDGTPRNVINIHKGIANEIYNNATTLEADGLARKVYGAKVISTGKESEGNYREKSITFDLDESEVNLLIAFINQIPFKIYIKKPLLDYLENLLPKPSKK